MTFKGHLLLAPLTLKLYSAENFKVSSKSGPKMAIFGEKGGVDVKFWFCNPKKAHPCAEPRLLTYFALMSVLAAGDC